MTMTAIAITQQNSCSTCTPNLMPFRINYSGPAPISTFFRVRDADIPRAHGGDEAEKATDTAFIPPKTTCGKQLVSAFRGRIVQGLEIVLPHGYQGLVLRDGLLPKVSQKERKKTRSTREDETRSGSETPEALRELSPSHTFTSFVLWNPDIPVDEGQDEYVRTLKEWTTLADELHSPEI